MHFPDISFGGGETYSPLYKRTYSTASIPSRNFIDEICITDRQLPDDFRDYLKNASLQVIGADCVNDQLGYGCEWLGYHLEGKLYMGEHYKTSKGQYIKTSHRLNQWKRPLASLYTHEAFHFLDLQLARFFNLYSEVFSLSPIFQEALQLDSTQANPRFIKWMLGPGKNMNNPFEIFCETGTELIGFPSLSSGEYEFHNPGQSFTWEDNHPQTHYLLQRVLAKLGIKTPGLTQATQTRAGESSSGDCKINHAA